MRIGTYTDRDSRSKPGKVPGMGSLKPTFIDRRAWFERLETALLRLHGIDINTHGGLVAAAKALGIASNTFNNWRDRGLPPEALPYIAFNAAINPNYILGLSDAMGAPLRAAPNAPGTLTDHSKKPHKKV